MIFRLAIGIIVIYLLYKLIRMGFPDIRRKSGSERVQTPVAGEELVEDPLCHTYVPLSQAFRLESDGKTIYFCSKKCLEQYGKK